MKWHSTCSRELHEPHERREPQEVHERGEEVRVGTSEWEVPEGGEVERRRGGAVEKASWR